MTRSFRVWSVLCGLMLTLSMVSIAAAQDTKRVVVLDFSGPSAGVARNEVVSALKSRSEVELVPQSALNGAESGSALTEAARDAQVSAVVDGRVAKKGKLLRVTVTVRDTDSGEVVKEEEWVRKKPQLKNLSGAVWGSLGSSIMRTRAPEKKAESVAKREEPREQARDAEREEPREERRAEAEPEPEPEEAEPDESASRTEGSLRHPALIASLGPRMMWRDLDFGDDSTLLGYSSYPKDKGSPAFNLALNVLWFPGAHVRSDWLSDIGLEVDVDYALALKSRQGNKKLDTTAYEASAGLIYRLPLDMFEPRFRVGYLKQVFDVDVPAGVALPAVSYSAVRAGAGCLVRVIDVLSFDVNFDVLIVLDTGDLGSKKYASDLSSFGWDVGGGVTYSFLEKFGVRLGIDYRRYSLDFGKSENTILVLPKDGSDSYLRTTASFVYTLAGK